MKKRVKRYLIISLFLILIAYPWIFMYWSLLDSDHDGLQKFEEKIKGTSDYKTDTDGDGIPDLYDMHPTGGDLFLVGYHEWSYQGQRYHVRIQVKADKYVYYSQIIGARDLDYITPNETEIFRAINSINESIKGTNITLKESILNFVQTMPYSLDQYSGYDEYHKFPIQTLVEGTGDCEDKVFLAATMLKAIGEDAIILYFRGEHYALGVKCDGFCTGKQYIFHKETYYYFETISPDYVIGQVPAGFAEKTPVILKP